MANEEQLSILKQGVYVWNEWREKNPTSKIDLKEVDLSRVDLNGVDLSGTDLSGADLSRADLSGANLSGAKLIRAYLNVADLSSADLRGADLTEANLRGVDLKRANLHEADLFQAHLEVTNLRGADLTEARLDEVNLTRADLTEAKLLETILSGAVLGFSTLADVDLCKVRGLAAITHIAPSTIGTNTLVKSKGKISETFLRGCGLSDWEIESAKLYNPDLSNDEIIRIQYRVYELRATQALQISPLFISYSHGNSEFVNRIEKSLTKKGIRFWRDIHDLKAGRIEKQIDQAISQNRTVLLVLSEDSLKSDWVEHEVRKAREVAKDTGRDTLCPVALDDSWKDSRWPKRVMEQIMEYNILDFSDWQNEPTFERTFSKLVDGLGLFYK